jgi:uncharacterized protein YciI
MNGLTDEDFPRGAGDPDFYGYPGQEEQELAEAESKRDAEECRQVDEYQQDGQS